MSTFACSFGGRLLLFFYYIWARPVGAQAGLGWTVHLGWGRYGSTREAVILSSLMWCAFIGFGIIAIGSAIRIYKLRENVFGKTQS
jgi:hypothetical protein